MRSGMHVTSSHASTSGAEQSTQTKVIAWYLLIRVVRERLPTEMLARRLQCAH